MDSTTQKYKKIMDDYGVSPSRNELFEVVENLRILADCVLDFERQKSLEE